MQYIFWGILLVSGSFIAQGSDPDKQHSLLGMLQKVSKKGLKERTGRKDFTPGDLYLAISSENNDMAKNIVEAQPALLHQKYKMDGNDDTGIAPFELAAVLYQGKQKPSEKAIEMVKYLLDMGADYSVSQPEKMVPAIATIVQKRADQRKGLVASLAASREKYQQYKQIESRVISLPRLHKQRTALKVLPKYEELEKYASSDLATLPIKTLTALQSTYKETEKLYADCLSSNATCPICIEEYSKKSPVLVCTNKHTVCHSCFNHPAMQKCPLCREQFSDREEFWKPIQLNFCQTCVQEKDTLGYTYCNDCSQVGMACPDCKAVPCCKKPRKALNPAEKILVLGYASMYQKHECGTRSGDLQAIDQTSETDLKKAAQKFSERAKLLEQQLLQIQENSTKTVNNFKHAHEEFQTVREVFETQLTDSISRYGRDRDAHKDPILRTCTMNLEEKRAILATLYAKLKEFASEEQEVYKEANKLKDLFFSEINQLTQRYRRRIQGRMDYAQELRKDLESVIKNS